jgi:hypothetical protein
MQQIEGQWHFPVQGRAILPGDVREAPRQVRAAAIANLCHALTERRLRQICSVGTVENRDEARHGRLSRGSPNQGVEPSSAGVHSGAWRAPQSDRNTGRCSDLQCGESVRVSVDDDGARRHAGDHSRFTAAARGNPFAVHALRKRQPFVKECEYICR